MNCFKKCLKIKTTNWMIMSQMVRTTKMSVCKNSKEKYQMNSK
jgi:hypothetical protein